MNYQKILIVLPDAIGDFLLLTPFIASLKRAHPQCVIGVIASPRNINLARANPDIDLTYLLNARKKHTLPKLLWQVRKQKYDLLIDLWLRRFSSSLKFFVNFSGIKNRFAIEKVGRFKTLQYENYYSKIFPLFKGQVRMVYNCILEYLGAEHVTEQSRLIYPLYPGVLEKAKGYIEHPCAVLVCEGSRGGNTLPPDACVEIVSNLLNLAPDLKVFLSSSPGENNIASTLAARLGGDQVKALPDIDGTLDFTAAIVALADVVISTSTATLHIADAFDTPTVGIYPKGYTTSLSPEYVGYYHFLPVTTKHAVVDSADPHCSLPVDIADVATATLKLLSPAE